MSVNTPNAGNVGITSSGGIAVATTASGAVGWINENAIIIGLGLSALSLIIGVVFKVVSEVRATKQAERHHQERLEAERIQNAQAHEALRIELLEAMKVKSD